MVQIGLSLFTRVEVIHVYHKSVCVTRLSVNVRDLYNTNSGIVL